MMKVSEAREAMKEFVNRKRGTNVLFATLDDSDKLTYVMIKSFGFYTFLKGSERIRRAMENAYAHQRTNFEVFTRFPTESMLISKD